MAGNAPLAPYLNSMAGRVLLKDIENTLADRWEDVAVQLTLPPEPLDITGTFMEDIKAVGNGRQQSYEFMKRLPNLGGNLSFEKFAKALDGAFLGRLAQLVRKAARESSAQSSPSPQTAPDGALLPGPAGTQPAAGTTVIINGGTFTGAAMNFSGGGGAHATNTTVNIMNYFKEQYDTETDVDIAKKIEGYANGGNTMSKALKDALENITKGTKLSVTEQAAIQLTRRPALFIRNDDYEFPATEDKDIQELYWKPKLDARHERLKEHIRCVGRVAKSSDALLHSGTAWIVADVPLPNAAERVVVTNRHVALLLFDPTTLEKLPGTDPTVDFKQEYNVAGSLVAKVSRALWIGKEVDVAFLLISGEGLPSGIPWSKREGRAPKGSEVALIGYPADDWKLSVIQDEKERARLFKGIYNVKRLQPGVVITMVENSYRHDASTLAGNSGSVVLDLADERAGALALHFGATDDGIRVLNLAHVMTTVQESLRSVKLPVAAPVAVPSTPAAAPLSRVRVLLKKDGQAKSLGALRDVDLSIPLALVRKGKMQKIESLPKVWRFLDTYGDPIGLAEEETLPLKEALQKEKDNQDAVSLMEADQ